jgi:hypothetical protein
MVSEENEIQRRIGQANRVYFTLLPIMRSRVIHRQTKLRLYKTVIRPVIMGMQVKAGPSPKKSELALDAFERKVLRRMLGPMKENNIWRIRYNNELYKQFDEPSLSNIKLKRLQRAGHVQRMEGKRVPKMILESIFIEKRPVGKPRKRWITAVEILKVRNWKRESLDR